MAAALPPLSELDPAEVWKPWKPDSAQPWSLKWAAHLYRRAAFAAPPPARHPSAWEGLRQAVRQGLEATLEDLFHQGPGQADYERLMDNLAPRTGQIHCGLSGTVGQFLDLKGWWLHRMVHTATPLRERMTLFWHNHFATSIAKVKWAAAMVRQNQLFRANALGKFRAFLLNICRDPAMLVWLDSNSNVKAKPNENFARELLELFTLGPGHYTEHDIREIARAFTGWHTAPLRNSPETFGSNPDDNAPGFVFNAREHDDGPKTVLGQTGSWNGRDVVRIVLEQPAAARFLVRRLYRAFLSEVDNPPDRLLEPLADRLRRSDYDIGDVVRTMLRSRLFFSDHAYRRRIKGPVEFVLGLLRGLDAETNPAAMALALEELDQQLFAPPSVKGWDGCRAWINSQTLVARNNLMWTVLTGGNLQATEKDGGRPVKPIRTDVVGLTRHHAGADPQRQVDFLLDLFLQGDCDAAARRRLLDYLRDDAGRADPTRRLRQTAHAVLSMPEYQLA